MGLQDRMRRVLSSPSLTSPQSCGHRGQLCLVISPGMPAWLPASGHGPAGVTGIFPLGCGSGSSPTSASLRLPGGCRAGAGGDKEGAGRLLYLLFQGPPSPGGSGVPLSLPASPPTAAMDDIFTQCREGNAVAVRLWLDNTENDLNQGDDHGFSPLHWACREGRSNVVDMLIMRGARINVMNRGDDTPLHLAASHGHRDIVQKLMQFKADINAVNEHGNTPLHYACFWGHEQVAEDLVGSGALVSIANKYGETPTDKAKTPLREVLKERAEKLGQSLTKIPYKDTFWKGTTRTRPRNGTLNKLAGIDFKQLTLSHKLNENQSGELWKGRWQGNDIVIKVLKIRDWTTRKSRDFNEEYPKLRIFSHPNVLPVLGGCQAPPAPHPVVISHWMPFGSLYNVLHEGTNFVVDQMQAVKFAFDIARGMAFLHTLEPLIPRHHLNSRSVMIDEDMTARISMADVKFSFQCPGRMYAPAWVAPEALQKKPEEINRRSADMWSFAVLLWELVTREVPFADLSNMEIGMKVALEGLRPTIPPALAPHHPVHLRAVGKATAKELHELSQVSLVEVLLEKLWDTEGQVVFS
uniref:Integrin linked kinase n=1 Tax=Ficedula albicollis TaxID=59894 RepID=A0A803VPK6_FICAL